jgi:hypothetical protein
MLRRLELARGPAADPPMAEPPLPPHDPDLCGFHRMLDVRAVTPILARALQAPARVRVLSVRYKPGKNAVVHYDVGAEAGWREAVMYAISAPGKLVAKANRRYDPAAGPRAAIPPPSPTSRRSAPCCSGCRSTCGSRGWP